MQMKLLLTSEQMVKLAEQTVRKLRLRTELLVHKVYFFLKEFFKRCVNHHHVK